MQGVASAAKVDPRVEACLFLHHSPLHPHLCREVSHGGPTGSLSPLIRCIRSHFFPSLFPVQAGWEQRLAGLARIVHGDICSPNFNNVM